MRERTTTNLSCAIQEEEARHIFFSPSAPLPLLSRASPLPPTCRQHLPTPVAAHLVSQFASYTCIGKVR